MKKIIAQPPTSLVDSLEIDRKNRLSEKATSQPRDAWGRFVRASTVEGDDEFLATPNLDEFISIEEVCEEHLHPDLWREEVEEVEEDANYEETNEELLARVAFNALYPTTKPVTEVNGTCSRHGVINETRAAVIDFTVETKMVRIRDELDYYNPRTTSPRIVDPRFGQIVGMAMNHEDWACPILADALPELVEWTYAWTGIRLWPEKTPFPWSARALVDILFDAERARMTSRKNVTKRQLAFSGTIDKLLSSLKTEQDARRQEEKSVEEEEEKLLALWQWAGEEELTRRERLRRWWQVATVELAMRIHDEGHPHRNPAHVTRVRLMDRKSIQGLSLEEIMKFLDGVESGAGDKKSPLMEERDRLLALEATWHAMNGTPSARPNRPARTPAPATTSVSLAETMANVTPLFVEPPAQRAGRRASFRVATPLRNSD